jgi:L-gulonolactone oxidase
VVQFFLFVGRYILYVNTLTGRFVAWLSSGEVTLVDDSPAIFNVECRVRLTSCLFFVRADIR